MGDGILGKGQLGGGATGGPANPGMLRRLFGADGIDILFRWSRRCGWSRGFEGMC